MKILVTGGAGYIGSHTCVELLNSGYTYITRCKECGVNPEVVMLWDGHEQEAGVVTSRVDRGYTDYSDAYLLSEAEKVNYEIQPKNRPKSGKKHMKSCKKRGLYPPMSPNLIPQSRFFRG